MCGCSRKNFFAKRSNEGSIGSSACCSARDSARCVVVSPPDTLEMVKRNSFTGVLAAAVLFGGAIAHAQTFTLSDIQNWVGTGANQAALVVAWNDGKTPDSLVFGYRWSAADADPTVFGMMQAIDAANPRFSFTAHPSFSAARSSLYSMISLATAARRSSAFRKTWAGRKMVTRCFRGPLSGRMVHRILG